MSTPPPDTVVLVHGLWVTPRSWEHWRTYYAAKGLDVIAPAYPGFEIEVEALREHPEVIAELTVPETVYHFAAAIEALDAPPIIIGHSFGGVITQLLLARGLGAAGVVIDSAPTEGVHVSPPSQLKSLFPALKNPATRHRAVGFTPEQFHYAFTNTLSIEDSQEVWERYTIPAPGYWVWEYGVFANLKPGHQETWVDYKADRAQLYRDLADGPFFGHNRRGDVSQGLRDAFWLQSMACGHQAAYECIAAFSATDFRADLAAIDVPTLVIHGDDDQIVPIDVGGRRAAALVAGARLTVYEGSGHALPDTDRDRLHADLLAFIDG